MVITRCPDCHARFRVTEGQLKLARGQVRCGACLTVFDARVHAVQESEAETAKADTHSAPHAAPEGEAAAHETNVREHRVREHTVQASTLQESTLQKSSLQKSTAQKNAPRESTSQVTPEPEPSATQPAKASIESAAVAAAGMSAGPVTFNAEPLAFHHDDSDDSPFVTSGWLLLSLLAGLALVAQLLWFERARLAEYPELGTIYTLICDQVDCSLQQNALTLIDNQGLHLQPHPQYTDALSATILLENKAAFSQPWPGLQLRFTDLKGRLVAQRTFQPEEYLDTTSVDPLRMPSSQPVQIELELAAPGRRGVSYELKLTPADSASAK